MATPLPILPRNINTDLASDFLTDGVCRFIKNLTLKKGANGISLTSLGQNEEKLKPLQANQLYAPFNAPAGINYCIGAKWFDITNEIYVWAWNNAGNHFIYKINCSFGTIEMVKVDRNFKFVLQPEYFIHENGCHLELIKLVDPITGVETLKRDLYWTDGLRYQGYLRVDDCIATNGFDATRYLYFRGNYDRDILIRMGVPTLDDCITISEVPLTSTDDTLNNDLLYKTWKFRVKGTDVFGRPTEHGIITYYVPGINDCISASSSNIPRCLTLVIKIDNPFIDTVDIEYLNDNGTVWYKSETIFLYVGDKINNWWLRQRNPDVIFNTETFELTTTFCADGEHEAVPPEETSRLYNPLPINSQGLVKLTKRLCLFNNKIGFNPLSQELLKKLKFSIEYPAATTDTDLATITIDIPIFNKVYNNYQQVSKDGTSGFVWGDLNDGHGGARPYLQFFANIAQSGWQGYLNDGDSVISTQYYIDAAGNFIEDIDFNGINLSPTHQTFQRFVFTNKQRKKYIFRLASHRTDPTITPNFQLTSTTVWGLCNYTKTGANFNIDTNGRLPRFELLVDCCNGDYNTLNDTKMLVIADLAAQRNTAFGNVDYKATSGYVTETNRNGSPEFPMELMTVSNPNTTDTICRITDHNGFYWYETSGEGRTFSFKFMNKCSVAEFTQSEGGAGMRLIDYVIEDVNDGEFSDYSLTVCNRVLIKGRAVLSGTDIGISNAIVTLTRGYTAITDNNGNFSVIAHDDMLNPTTGRFDDLVFGSACIYHATEGCIELINVHIVPCSSCVERVVNTNGWVLTTDNFTGPLSGGSYLAQVCCGDWLGRRQFVQTPVRLNIPTVAQTGVIAPCRIKLDIDTTALFPSNFKFFSVFITAELNYADYLEWIIGDVEFIDATGAINTVNPTQIRIGYNSLNEYNKQNYFSTTTNWQFLVQSASNPITGDKIQFQINDGEIYRTSITSLIKYDSIGQFILLDYKPVLKTLKKGAKVRLVRPKESYSQAEPFYEMCDTKTDLNNGVPSRYSMYVNIEDTNYLNRQIPVPSSLNNQTEIVTVTTPTEGGGSVSVQNTQNVAYSNQLTTPGFYFEHHSPSNFWGYKCWNYGRVNYRNVDEAELINYNEVALSGFLLPTGILSYLQYFDRTLATSFDIANTGGLVGVLVMMGRLLWVTQHFNFQTSYNDNLLRQQPDGTISSNVQNGFGSPDATVDPQYGCLLRDKNTIGVRSDAIIFLDTTLCELVGLRPTSQGGTIHYTKTQHDVFTIDKIKSVIGSNRHFHKAINPLTDEYLLSDFNLDEISYINQERWYNSERNETISFDINTGKFLGQFSFTPELYAYADGDIKNKNLFSFKNALPYNHYNLSTNTLFNTFYGVVCERVLVIVSNGNILDEKSFKWIEEYTKHLYYSPEIKTESGQISRLAKSQFKRSVRFYKASFLSDQNTPDVNNRLGSKLFEGNGLYGRWIEIKLVGDAKENSIYTELAGIIVFSVPIEKSGVK